MSHDEETFDAARYEQIVIKDSQGREIEVSGDAAGSYRWDGSDLPAVYEAGSGGVMLEPAESSFPTDIIITGLTEAKARYLETQQEVELSEAQQLEVIERLNQDKDFIDSIDENIRDAQF